MVKFIFFIFDILESIIPTNKILVELFTNTSYAFRAWEANTYLDEIYIIAAE